MKKIELRTIKVCGHGTENGRQYNVDITADSLEYIPEPLAKEYYWQLKKLIDDIEITAKRERYKQCIAHYEKQVQNIKRELELLE